MHLHKMSMPAAGGVGYVLGTRAGRGRYEQMRHAMHEMPQARQKAMAAADCVRHGDFTGAFAAAAGHQHDTTSPDPSRAPRTGPVASPYDVGWPGDDPDLPGPV